MTTRILCLRLLPPADERSHPSRPAFSFDAPLRAQLAGELEEFSPLIGWVDGIQHACLCLDISRTASWFGGEAALVERLKEWTEQRHWSCRVVIADTLGAAWGVAHFGWRERPTSWACRTIAPSQSQAALASLPIEALRLSPATAVLLRELGIDKIAHLLTLPHDALAERFEPDLLLRIHQALGHTAEWFEPYQAPPRYEASLTWDNGVGTAEPILEVCQALLPRLILLLQQQSQGIARWSAELLGESGSLGRLVIGLLRPTLELRHLIDLLRLRLESVRLLEPVTGMRVAIIEAAPLPQQQQVLFADLAPPVESEDWSILVERLSGRLGSDAVVRVRSYPDHQPERTWKGVPWIHRQAKRLSSKKNKAAQVETAARSLPRPTLLLPQPRSIRVLAVAPQGHPHQYRDDGRDHRVARSWGPERIETGWWRGPHQRRDYYRVETESGVRSWLFHDLRRGGWYLHGWFD